MALTLQPPAAARPAPAATGTARREVAAGAVAMAPFAAGYSPFALAIGAAVAASGHRGPGLAATWLVYGGSAQLAVVRLLDAGASAGVVFLAGLLVNLRLAVYSASMAPLWRDERRWFTAVAGALLVEPSLAVGRARYERPGTAADRRCFYLGAALSLWAVWSTAVATGALLGAGIGSGLRLEVAAPLCLAAALGPSLAATPGRAAASAGAATALATLALPVPAGSEILLAAVAGAGAGHLAARGRR